MKAALEIPDYDPNNGLNIHWEYGFEISVNESKTDILIRSNQAGLISLAIQLLTLAQDAVPAGCHGHYDQFNSLETGSKQLIKERSE